MSLTKNVNSMTNTTMTRGMQLLNGDPKIALKRMSLSIMVLLSFYVINSFFDAFWIAGLGANALAAVGYFFSIFMIIMALATGIGIGSSAAISRLIGAGDIDGARHVFVHGMIIVVIIDLLLGVPFYIFMKEIYVMIGAGDATLMAIEYSQVLLGGFLVFFLNNLLMAVFRGEGDIKRTMLALGFSTVLNLILTPVLIYGLKLGVAGAAWASIISAGISCLLLGYWIFIKKITYIKFSFNKIKLRFSLFKNILHVSLPASLEQISMGIVMFIINILVTDIAGTHGVAVYTTGWRVVRMATLPLMGIGPALISVIAFNYGQKRVEKIKQGFFYATRFGFIIEMSISVIVFIIAPYIAAAFMQHNNMNNITADLTFLIRVLCVIFPLVVFGVNPAALFQAIGKGFNAMMVTVVRTLILVPLFAYILAIVFKMNLPGVWYSIVLANIIGGAWAFTWAHRVINKIFVKN